MRNVVAAAVFTAVWVAAAGLGATAQVADVLTVGDRTYALTTNPLEQFLKRFPEKRPKSGVVSSGCWRGYRAYFEIRDRELVLRKVEVEKWDPSAERGALRTTTDNVMGELFPGASAVTATWYSGTLIVPYGNMVNYVHMGYGSSYERYLLFTVDKGKVVKQLRMSFEEFMRYRKRQFAAFKKTPEYKALFASSKSGDATDEQIDGFLFDFAAEQYLSMDFSKASAPSARKKAVQKR